jgi:hypothetical protein
MNISALAHMPALRRLVAAGNASCCLSRYRDAQLAELTPAHFATTYYALRMALCFLYDFSGWPQILPELSGQTSVPEYL